MRNSVKAVLAAIAAVGVSALFAAPASAGSGPPVVGCGTDSSCTVQVPWTVTGSTGGSRGWTPPPCIGVPAGDAYSGSQVIISIYGNNPPVPAPTVSATGSATASAAPSSSPSTPDLTPQEQQMLDQAQQLLNTKPEPAGYWYQISGDPAASAASQQDCNTLPPYVWVRQGGKLPAVGGGNVLAVTLASFAYSQLQTGQINRVTFNPRRLSDTNLPTAINAVLTLPIADIKGGGLLQVAGPGTLAGLGTPFTHATAEAPDGTAATVWAWVTGFHIDVQPAGTATVFQDQTQCIHVSGTPIIQDPDPNGPPIPGLVVGSLLKSKMKDIGVGQPIDCGVTFTAPGTYTVSVSVSWNACWTEGTEADVTTPGPPAGKDAAGKPLCQPVPGAGGLGDSVANVTMPVREIQSVNG